MPELKNYLVLMTSTGEAMMVAQNPATTAEVKGHGMPSLKRPLLMSASLAVSLTCSSCVS